MARLMGVELVARRCETNNRCSSRSWRNIVAAIVVVACTGAAHAHLPHDPVMGLGISPDFANDQTLFVATFPETNWSYREIYRSTDAGKNWSKVPNGMDNRSEFSAIRLSPSYSTDQAVFAATRGDGIYRSLDNGASWALFNTGLASLNIKELRIGGARNTDYVLFAAPSNGGMYRRASSQASWTSTLAKSVSVSALAVSPEFTQDGTVMTTDANGRLRVSSDGGLVWADYGIPVAATIYDLAIAPGGAKEVFMATNQTGVFYSDNGGKTFAKKLAGLPAEGINNVAVSPNYLVDHTVFCTSIKQSVFRSTDSGATWTLYNSKTKLTRQTAPANEFSELQVSNTYASDRSVFLSAFDGLYRSSTSGTTWSEVQTRYSLATGLAFSPKFASDNRLMATNYYSGGVMSSVDAGASWSVATNGWPAPGQWASAFDIDFVPNHIGAPLALAAKNFGYIGFSDNFGGSWTMLPLPEFPAKAPGPIYPTVEAISPAFDQDGEIYLATIDHGVIQSRDGGHTWRTNGVMPSMVKVSSVVVSPNYANDRTAFAAALGGQVWRTTDGGDNWARVGTTSITTRGGIKYMWLAISPAFANDHLVLVGTNKGVYRSTDGGTTWQSIGHALLGSTTVVREIEFSPSFATDRTVYFNVRGRGLYRVTLSNTGSVATIQNVGTWLLQHNIEFTELRLSPNFAQDATIIGASRNSAFRSTDGGATWSKIGDPVGY